MTPTRRTGPPKSRSTAGWSRSRTCAIAAKRKKPGLRLAVLEKNDRVGKKLLATGNGRCNLTHEAIGAENYVGKGAKALVEPILKKYDAKRLLDFFGELGLLTVSDSEGRFYPLSRQASTVLDVLRFNCEALGVEIFCGEAAEKPNTKTALLSKPDKTAMPRKSWWSRSARLPLRSSAAQ